MKANNIYFYDSPLGSIMIAEDGAAITKLYFSDGAGCRDLPSRETVLLKEAVIQLEEYFAGKRKLFDLPVAPAGTAFQLKVWEALREIPYGQTRSYGQVAQSVGNGKAARAVGMANSKNPISIIIPCHRVIGSGGKLVGYGGGLDRKAFLLELEKSRR
ncbi:MAG: methylated-DNA--[protein]-cysteine S-methyltransferase [Firmicutes bacterium]|jgi:methylated-DNA-[protein]-cysteine S-methyltransferase|nr:methylated-DNA--[protein]-cysteine S-methyltransferase [Bacillota bacterium]